MRKIDWESPLTDDDIVWLRNSGQFDIEDRIARHQEQFGEDVPEAEVAEDTLTQSALDPSARRNGERVEGTGDGAPKLVNPTDSGDVPLEDEGDDYDAWKVAELEEEVAARDALEGTSQVTVEGTGKDGAIRKVDLVKGLRLWDQENPGALDK